MRKPPPAQMRALVLALPFLSLPPPLRGARERAAAPLGHGRTSNPPSNPLPSRGLFPRFHPRWMREDSLHRIPNGLAALLSSPCGIVLQARPWRTNRGRRKRSSCSTCIVLSFSIYPLFFLQIKPPPLLLLEFCTLTIVILYIYTSYHPVII